MTAFEGLLPENTFPFYVVFMEIDPKHIDVNVHPTKTEIKFDDERSVYAVVRSAVRQAIGSHNLTPGLDFNADVNIISKLNQGPKSNEVYFEERFSTSLHRSNSENWEKLFEGNLPGKLMSQSEATGSQTIRFESSINKSPEESRTESKVLFQLHDRYIVREVRSGMMIVNQQAAHERILFEKFLHQLRTQSAESQQSLFPQTVNLSPADFAMIMEMEREIKALGFRFEPFGRNAIVVDGIPSGVSSGREKELFEGLLEQFKINQSELAIPLQENLARSLAKKASIKAGQKLGREEMQSLIDQVFGCKTPNYSPEGIPTYFIFELSKIESYFSRL
jgi:DNA mismatch repair protein MutL